MCVLHLPPVLCQVAGDVMFFFVLQMPLQLISLYCVCVYFVLIIVLLRTGLGIHLYLHLFIQLVNKHLLNVNYVPARYQLS